MDLMSSIENELWVGIDAVEAAAGMISNNW